MEVLKCQDVPCKGPEKRNKLNVATTTQNIPTPVVRFHAGSRNRRTCAVSHFGENILGAAVSAPAIAMFFKSLFPATTSTG